MALAGRASSPDRRSFFLKEKGTEKELYCRYERRYQLRFSPGIERILPYKGVYDYEIS